MTSPFLSVEGVPVYFEENWSTGIGGGLWSTGKAMAMYFVNHRLLLRQNIKNLVPLNSSGEINALELGSGNGLLSVCLCAAVGDLIQKVAVTDLEDHLELIHRTLSANSHIVTMEENNRGGVKKPFLSVKEHHWGSFDDYCEDEKYDFIFGSDVAYRDWLHEPLIKSLKHYSHPGTISLIGVTMHDTKPQFFRLLKENGFTYQRLPDLQMEPEYRGTTFGLFVIQLS
jgi:Putative methyltransferase.